MAQTEAVVTVKVTDITEVQGIIEQGQAAVAELAQLKPLFAWAVSCLPGKQLKISLSEQTRLGELDLQFKAESSGTIVFRAVKS